MVEQYHFLKADIVNYEMNISHFEKEQFDLGVHFAAESHVDCLILDPIVFVRTNVVSSVTYY